MAQAGNWGPDRDTLSQVGNVPESYKDTGTMATFGGLCKNVRATEAKDPDSSCFVTERVTEAQARELTGLLWLSGGSARLPADHPGIRPSVLTPVSAITYH